MPSPLTQIELDLHLCSACERAWARNKIVPGEGREDAPVFLIGEAPGHNEDRNGRPFIGASGKKLSEWLKRAGLDRTDLYITNVLKCYGGTRVPFPEDENAEPIVRCLPWLHRQLCAVSPLAILVMGKQALQHAILRDALDQPVPFDQWVGRVCRHRETFGETRIGVAYHPAKILRSYSPYDERRSIEALEKIGEYVRARLAGDPAPLLDLHEIRPGGSVTFQQRLALFGDSGEETGTTCP